MVQRRGRARLTLEALDSHGVGEEPAAEPIVDPGPRDDAGPARRRRPGEVGLQRPVELLAVHQAALLEQRLAREHIDAAVVNASISGDTTAGGLARLPTLLRERKPGLVVIELGANDALRGLPIETTRANLLAMTRLAKDAGAKVLIVGMQLPPNYGRAYGDRFAAIFADVPGITWGDALYNWVFAFLGNFVGAAVFVSTAYWYLYVRGTPDEGAPETASEGAPEPAPDVPAPLAPATAEEIPSLREEIDAIDADLLRLSVGLESVDDVIADLDKAMANLP